MKKIKLFSTLFVIYCTLFTICYATPSTHIWAPSTDVQAFKKWHLTSDFYAATENNADGSRMGTITNLGLTTGVLPYEKLNAEIGFDHKSGLGVLDKDPFYFNFKVGIPENAYGNLFPGLAFGIYDLGTKKDATNFNVLYGKAGKTITLDKLNLGRFSLGYFSGNPDLLLYNNGKDNTGVLACWERTITEISDKLWVAVEYQGSKSAYGALTYGFSYKLDTNTSFILGQDVYNDSNLPDTFTMQVDVDF